MRRRTGLGRVVLTRALGVTMLLGACATSTFAQEWVPPAGVGSVTVSFQNLDYSGHFATDGEFFEDVGNSVHNRVDLEADFAITDRLSITVGIPFVFTRYTDPDPLPPFVPFLPVDDCRCWHSGWQDFGFTARYNLVNGAFGLTPSVSVGVPSHGYDFQGEAVLGERLKELRIAVDAGHRLDFITPRLSVQGRYSYAFVEQVLDDVPVDRSNAALEGEFLITRRLAARGVLMWQRVHRGLRLGSASEDPFAFPGEVNTPERMFEHDRLLRDNNFRVGGSVGYSLEKMDVFFSYFQLLQGNDSHGGRAITVGVSWPFEIRRRPAP
jgi:hypothetical protein